MILPESVQRLLAFLALRNRPQHRLKIATTLWMDTTEERAAANLRTAIWRARRVQQELVISQGAYVAIGPSVDVDITEMLKRVRRLVDDDEPVNDALACTMSLSGDLLPEWYDDWVLLERERLRQIRLHGLEALCVRLSDQGCYSLAIEAGLIAVAEEPLRESAHRAVMNAHLQEGNMAEAVRQYDRFAAVLFEHLAIAPTDGLRALVAPCR